MYEVNAQRYVRTVNSLEAVSKFIRQAVLDNKIDEERPAAQDMRSALAKSIREYAEDCDAFGARASRDNARRVADTIEGSDLPWREIDLLSQHAAAAFFDEMARFHVLFLNEDEARMYAQAEQEAFGQDVMIAFPSGTTDMSEACKCLALGRGTASVFHLMRLLELSCKAVWVSLGATSTNPNLRGWGDYKREIDTYLKNDKKGNRPSDWITKKPEYEDMHAHLSSVYTAWRNTTMHVENTYTPAHAKEIMDAVVGLTKSIARHINEDGTYTP